MYDLRYTSPYMGCDPEFFFSKNGNILGAEKVIPQDGIEYIPYTAKKRDGDYTSLPDTKSKIVIDGVQAEINPRPNNCRANLGNEISACFWQLYEKIKTDESLKIDFSPVVSVTKEEMATLSEKSKIFGCAPSMNIYTNEESKIKVNPSVYSFRSAGGHIHLGEAYKGQVAGAFGKPERLVPILDILLGNTCVLLDRNEWNKERRKVYGRAGEYRLPAHGLEYRTLSNFWLQSYQLMSFVMGMARMSLSVVVSELRGGNTESAFLKAVSREDITNAINHNDYELAFKNYEKVEPLIVEMIKDNYDHYPISSRTVLEFRHFIKKSIYEWFNHNTLEHWIKLPEGHETGWESFCLHKVHMDRTKEKK